MFLFSSQAFHWFSPCFGLPVFGQAKTQWLCFISGLGLVGPFSLSRDPRRNCQTKAKKGEALTERWGEASLMTWATVTQRVTVAVTVPVPVPVPVLVTPDFPFCRECLLWLGTLNQSPARDFRLKLPFLVGSEREKIKGSFRNYRNGGALLLLRLLLLLLPQPRRQKDEETVGNKGNQLRLLARFLFSGNFMAVLPDCCGLTVFLPGVLRKRSRNWP